MGEDCDEALGVEWFLCHVGFAVVDIRHALLLVHVHVVQLLYLYIPPSTCSIFRPQLRNDECTDE